MPLKSIKLLDVSIVGSFLLLNSASFYTCTSLFTYLLKNIQTGFSFWQFILVFWKDPFDDSMQSKCSEAIKKDTETVQIASDNTLDT